MKKYLILFLFIVIKIQAQSNFNTTSFEVTIGDLVTNVYPQDTTANALVVFEQGNSFISNKTFNLITEIKRKIKIFNKNELNGKATVEVLLYKSDKKYRKEEIKNIVAITYNLVNNTIIKSKINKKDVFEEIYDKNHTIVKFTMPKIKNGSVFTYSYTLESPFIYKYKGWTFQEEIPVLYSEYNTSIPGNYDYNIKLVGGLKLSINESVLKRKCLTVGNGGEADCVNTKYAMENVPAFIEENYMTAKDNYLSRIDYELKVFKGFDGAIDKITKSWKDADKEIKDNINIGKQLNKISVTKDLISSSIANETNSLKRAKSIYEYVKNTYTWNNEHLFFKDVSIKNLIKNKSGKASEINILLHNLLKLNNIKVKPILLSTRKNGFATKLYPVISDFNYLIIEANINGKLYLLDATDKYLSFGRIPFKCLNKYGRLMDFKNGSQWINIKADKNSTIQHQVNLNLSEDGILSGIINSRYLGYHALLQKKSFFSNADKHLEDFENKYPFLDVKEHTIKSKDKSNEEFQESFEIEVNDLNMISDVIYFDPFIFKFFTKNPFQLQQRTYPIDFGYKDSYLYSFEIDLNDFYEVIKPPKDVKVKLPNNAGEFLFASKIIKNKITIFFKINFNESIYPSEYYKYLKEFMSKIVETQTKTLIVLKKK